ncbi:unnamed protein product [Euphydryas editha]|uniref:THAP-type domain-containing protein n=1 Tax=Euphydryas editha TaxID=104508 RepID=A0AAU9TQ50_EUPED|nr:unnamed protein product [Euphydryas editha]
MPSCCIKQCSARKRNNQPTLTFHRFPTNEIMKKKWLEIIGSENIKPRLKSLFVCSMHFDESSFNRTLDIVRLRDGIVPSSQLGQHTQSTLELTLNSQPSVSVMISDPQTSTEIGKLVLQERQENVASEQILLPKNEKIYHLTQKCENLKKKVKQLNEKVRRRDKKIALLSHILKDLQKRNLLKSEETLILEECAGPEDFLKKQIAKSRGIPLEKKIS